jgi:lysophospholipase L1-like esterase
MRRPFGALAVAVLAAALAPPATAQTLDRLGAIGDSLTDEYDDQNFGGYARNWLELLVEQRGVEVGPTAAQAGQPGGTWGEPRRTGYQDNWARSSADTDSAIAQGQHTGLAGAVVRGVTHAAVFIGNNDFRPGTDDTYPYNAIYNGVWTPQQIEAHLDDSIADLGTLITPLENAGYRIAVANAFDFGSTPTVELFFPNAVFRDRVTAVLTEFSNRVRALAEDRHLAFVDLLAFGKAAFGTNTAPRSTLLVGNVAINLNLISSQSGTAAGFVEDGIHPHTVVQGVIANIWLAALDQHLGACVAPFTEAQLLAHNGLAYGGSNTLLAEIGRLSRFVESFPAPGEPLFADGFECGSTVAWSS